MFNVCGVAYYDICKGTKRNLLGLPYRLVNTASKIPIRSGDTSGSAAFAAPPAV